MDGAALAAGTTVSFVLTNSSIAGTDLIVLNHVTTGTFGSYTLNGRCLAGSAGMMFAMSAAAACRKQLSSGLP